MFRHKGIDFRFQSRETVGRDWSTLIRRTHVGWEFEEITPFGLGDEPRSIDMKRSIFELNTLYSKRMSESREYTLSVIIPLTASIRFWTADWSLSSAILLALKYIAQDLDTLWHNGEIILLVDDRFEIFPLTRLIDVERFKKIFISHLRSVEKNPSLSPREMVGLFRHLCRTADRKIAVLSSEELPSILRDRIVSLHTPLHEFIIEHLAETSIRRWLLARLRWILQDRMSSRYQKNPIHSHTPHASITRIYSTHTILLWLIQGFRQLG